MSDNMVHEESSQSFHTFDIKALIHMAQCIGISHFNPIVVDGRSRVVCLATGTSYASHRTRGRKLMVCISMYHNLNLDIT